MAPEYSLALGPSPPHGLCSTRDSCHLSDDTTCLPAATAWEHLWLLVLSLVHPLSCHLFFSAHPLSFAGPFATRATSAGITVLASLSHVLLLNTYWHHVPTLSPHCAVLSWPHLSYRLQLTAPSTEFPGLCPTCSWASSCAGLACRIVVHALGPLHMFKENSDVPKPPCTASVPQVFSVLFGFLSS